VKKPILVVTTHFVKPVETRIDNEFEVRRKSDGTPFQHDELLPLPKERMRYSSLRSIDSTPISLSVSLLP
jgi:hypothetical protein